MIMKIILLGDSITEGIGSRKVNFAPYLEQAIKGSQVINLGKSGTTIDYAITKIDEINNHNPDITVVFYGQVDALTRVKSNTWIYGLIPKRYKGPGMFDPRALFTRKQSKKVFQKIDSFFRYNLKKFLISVQGYEQWNTLDEFEKKYDYLIKNILDHSTQIICLSTVSIKDKYFPYCNREFKKYNEVIFNISQKHNCTFLDIYKELDNVDKEIYYYEDYYHPNEKGYKLIAEKILSNIELDVLNE